MMQSNDFPISYILYSCLKFSCPYFVYIPYNVCYCSLLWCTFCTDLIIVSGQFPIVIEMSLNICWFNMYNVITLAHSNISSIVYIAYVCIFIVYRNIILLIPWISHTCILFNIYNWFQPSTYQIRSISV